MPYFITDNHERVTRILHPKSRKKTPLEIAAERHAKRTDEQKAEILRKWNNNRKYLRLKANPDYVDVEYCYENGGLKARHKGHIIHSADNEELFFDGKYTSTQLEFRCQDILYKNGHSCILANEVKIDIDTGNMMSLLDTITDGEFMDIRAITKDNRNTIRNAVESKKNQLKRFNEQNKEDASSLILYFEDTSFYDEGKVMKTLGGRLKKILCVLNTLPHGKILILKK